MTDSHTATADSQRTEVQLTRPLASKEKAEDDAKALRGLVAELKTQGVSTLLVEYMGIDLGSRDKIPANTETYQRPVLKAWLPECPGSGVGIAVRHGLYWWGEGQSKTVRHPESAAVAIKARLLELKPVE